MKIFFLLVIIACFLYEVYYYRQNHIPYNTYTIFGVIFLIIQIVLTINYNVLTYERQYQSELQNIIYYFIHLFGYYFFGLMAIYINYIPIYEYDNNLNKGIFQHYFEILKTKNSNCSRLDYWFFIIGYILSISCVSIICVLIKMEELSTPIIVFLWVIHLIFKAKRLNDAGISKSFLFVYLIGLLGYSFNFITVLVMFAILSLPSQKIATTQLHTNSTKE